MRRLNAEGHYYTRLWWWVIEAFDNIFLLFLCFNLFSFCLGWWVMGHGSWLLTRLWSSNISWWLGSTERAALQSRSAPNTSPMCSWKAALRCRRWRSALNAIALDSSAIASFSLWLSIKTAPPIQIPCYSLVIHSNLRKKKKNTHTHTHNLPYWFWAC